MSNVFLKVLLEFSELNNSNGGAIRQRCNATTYRVTVPSLLKAEDSEKEEREVIKMRFKTVAVFDNYEVVEPTEPVKRIEVIDIRKRSVASVPVKHNKHKISKDEYDRELTISAIVASVIPILFVFGMIVTWIVFGY